MRVIDDVILSDSIIEERFVCDLEICKGRCCEEGDSGAPLAECELPLLEEVFPQVRPYMTPMGLAAVEEKGLYLRDRDFEWVTPCLERGLCAYALKDRGGHVRCAIEKAWYEGKITWKKPLSCHLFPIRVRKSPDEKELEFWNYQPRLDLCATSKLLGKKLGRPLFEFLKEPIIRAKGEGFYLKLEVEGRDFEEMKSHERD